MTLPRHISPVRATAMALALGGALAAGPAMAQTFEADELAPNVLMVSGLDGNVVVGVEPESLTLIDGGSAENAEALLDFIRAETGVETVGTLVNTHWHDHATGANEALGAAGTEIVAHANTKQWLEYGTENFWLDETYDPRPEDALPTTVIYEDVHSLPFGEGEIVLGHLLDAHTDGDIYAWFPGENVLAAGGALSSDGWNMLDWWTGGYMGGVLDAYEILLEVADEETVIVPGSGPAMSYADLQAQYEMYAELYDRLGDMLKSAFGPDEVVAANPTEGFHPEWEDAERFARLAYRSYYAHMRGDRRLGAIP